MMNNNSSRHPLYSHNNFLRIIIIYLFFNFFVVRRSSSLFVVALIAVGLPGSAFACLTTGVAPRSGVPPVFIEPPVTSMTLRHS